MYSLFHVANKYQVNYQSLLFSIIDIISTASCQFFVPFLLMNTMVLGIHWKYISTLLDAESLTCKNEFSDIKTESGNEDSGDGEVASTEEVSLELLLM